MEDTNGGVGYHELATGVFGLPHTIPASLPHPPSLGLLVQLMRPLSFPVHSYCTTPLWLSVFPKQDCVQFEAPVCVCWGGGGGGALLWVGGESHTTGGH